MRHIISGKISKHNSSLRVKKRFALFPIRVYEKLNLNEGRYVEIWLCNYYVVQKRRPSGNWQYLPIDYRHKKDAEFAMGFIIDNSKQKK